MIAFAVFFSVFMAGGAIGCSLAVIALAYLLIKRDQRGVLGTALVALTALGNLACSIGGGLLCAVCFKAKDYQSPIALGLVLLVLVQLMFAVAIVVVAIHTSKRKSPSP